MASASRPHQVQSQKYPPIFGPYRYPSRFGERERDEEEDEGQEEDGMPGSKVAVYLTAVKRCKWAA
jgi:hypothetical protein